MNEEFKNTKTGDIRKNEHILYMPTQKYILSLAKDIGFILHSKNSMIKCKCFIDFGLFYSSNLNKKNK